MTLDRFDTRHEPAGSRRLDSVRLPLVAVGIHRLDGHDRGFGTSGFGGENCMAFPRRRGVSQVVRECGTATFSDLAVQSILQVTRERAR